jgi:hypothetical protein
VKTKSFFNQTITLLLAAMLLMVAGVKSSSLHKDATRKLPAVAKSIFHGLGQDADSGTTDTEQATVSSLALDAVITPALSFDFSQYFYFLPPAVWHFIQREVVTEVSFPEPSFLVSGFCRIFGSYVVTNAP